MLAFISLALLVSADPGQAASPASTTPAANPQDKIICKRFVETGSLVRGYRSCKTKREWDREQEDVRAQGPSIDSCRERATGGC